MGSVLHTIEGTYSEQFSKFLLAQRSTVTAYRPRKDRNSEMLLNWKGSSLDDPTPFRKRKERTIYAKRQLLCVIFFTSVFISYQLCAQNACYKQLKIIEFISWYFIPNWSIFKAYCNLPMGQRINFHLVQLFPEKKKDSSHTLLNTSYGMVLSSSKTFCWIRNDHSKWTIELKYR